MIFILPATLVMAVPAVFCIPALLTWCAAERVHEVNTRTFTPSLEGALVKCRVQELHTEWGEAAQPQFGVSRPGALVLRSWFEPPAHSRTSYTSLCGVSTGTGMAPRILSGVREFRFKPGHLLSELKMVRIDPLTVQLPESFRPLVEDATPEYLLLRISDFSNLAVPHLKLCFEYAPSPQNVNLYVMGRLQNNVVEVSRTFSHYEYVSYDRYHDLFGWKLVLCGCATVFFTSFVCLGTALFSECIGWRWRARYVMLMSLYSLLLLSSGVLAIASWGDMYNCPHWLPWVTAGVAVVCMVLNFRAAQARLLPTAAGV